MSRNSPEAATNLPLNSVICLYDHLRGLIASLNVMLTFVVSSSCFRVWLSVKQSVFLISTSYHDGAREPRVDMFLFVKVIEFLMSHHLQSLFTFHQPLSMTSGSI